MISEMAFALVTYGSKGRVEQSAGCPAYDFTELDQGKKPRLLCADRLKTYVHFIVMQGKLRLIRFYIPPGAL